MKKLLLATLFGCTMLTHAQSPQTISQPNTNGANQVNNTLPQPAATESNPATNASEGCGCTGAGENSNAGTSNDIQSHDVAKQPVQGS